MDVLFADEKDVYTVEVVAGGSVRYNGATVEENRAYEIFNEMATEYDNVKDCTVILYLGKEALAYSGE